MSDKFDNFGTLFLIFLFNKSILLPVNDCKIAGGVATVLTLDSNGFFQHTIILQKIEKTSLNYIVGSHNAT